MNIEVNNNPQWVKGCIPDGYWKDPANRRGYMKWLEGILGYSIDDDWYQITQKTFDDNYGKSFINYFKRSPFNAIKDYRPGYPWEKWLFKGSVGNNFWCEIDNCNHYMVWLGNKLGYADMDDWYQLSASDLIQNNGRGIMKHFGMSPTAILLKCFPNYNWKPWLFNNVPLNFWKESENIRSYMGWLEIQIGYKKTEDWYQVKSTDFKKNNGRTLLRYMSHIDAVMGYIPEYDWKIWKFKQVPEYFWDDLNNRNEYMKWLGHKLGYTQPEDWYGLTISILRKNYGRGLLASTDIADSPSTAVIDYIPDHNWKVWKFKQVPKGFWEKCANKRKYMSWLENKLGYRNPENWYMVKENDFSRNMGHSLLKYYDSMIDIVVDLVDNYDFMEWKFNQVPNGFWSSPRNRKRYLEWLGQEKGFEKQEDWYNITISDFKHGQGLLVGYYNGSPSLAVIDNFRFYKWEIEKFTNGKKKQTRIFSAIKDYFKERKVELEFKHPDLKFQDSGRLMELDVFIPYRNIAIEYQGEQHYFIKNHWGGNDELQNIRNRDEEKRSACKREGIRLLEVTYEWNGNRDELIDWISAFIKDESIDHRIKPSVIR